MSRAGAPGRSSTDERAGGQRERVVNRQIFLFGFVPVGLALFRLMPPSVATASVLIGSAAFLPELTEYDPPLIPPINKHSIGSIVALAGCLWVAPGRIGKRRMGAGADWLILALVASAWLTVATNGEATYTTAKRLQALGMRDGISMGIWDLLFIGIPFYLGRCLNRTPRDLRALFTTLTVVGLFYGLLVLYESRMSPQLHRMLYGVHPNNFAKTFRLGGYRPMVFMESGLAVSIFMLTCTMAAFGLARARIPMLGLPSKLLAGVLAFVLLVCRSLGAILYGMVVLPVLAFAPRRTAPLAIAGLAAVVVAYPTIRYLDLMPLQAIHDAAARINPVRADSLVFRFENEDQIVDRARQKPLFGWGGYQRSRVRVDNQQEVSAADGFWVIVLGQRGMVGLALTLALLVWPQLRVARRLSRVRDRRAQAMMTALALMVGIRAFDMMPNGSYGTLPFFLAGALYGVTEWKTEAVRRPRPALRADPAASARSREAARAATSARGAVQSGSRDGR